MYAHPCVGVEDKSVYLLFETVSLTEPEACHWNYPSCPSSPHDWPVSNHPALRLKRHASPPGFYVGARDLNLLGSQSLQI